jgi:CheY-like chemotaxis protein
MKGISEKEGFTDKSMGYLENIEMSSKNLSAIINDILDLSKIESGKLELDNEDFQLEQIIKNVYHLNKSSAKEKGIKFSYTLDEMLPNFIYGDRTKLMQVLMNLTSNAIKFTAEGKEVRIKAKKQSDRLVFLVEDEGIGIDSNRLDSIFDPFEQEDTSVTREFGGSGLGLAISRSIVTLMQGIITVQSTKDKGSTFKVTLPLIAANPTNTEAQHEFSNLNNVKFDDNFKVLLVEDNALNQDLVKALMEQINVELIIASNGLEGIELVKKHLPSAILMDMHMPGMDGLETIKRIKENSETCNIPVIAYSADAFAETRKLAYEIGAVDYLTKPLDLNKLLSVLNRFGRSPLTELDFGDTKKEDLGAEPHAKVNIPEKHKGKCKAHTKNMLKIPIFESEKLLKELDSLKAFAEKNKIDLLDKPKLIADAIYDGNEKELVEQLNSIQ